MLIRTPADSRAVAKRLLESLRRQLPTTDAGRADAAHRALRTSGLLDSSNLSSSAVAAAVRDGLTSLAHLLDEDAPGHGAGQLLLLVLAETEAFTPHPAPSKHQIIAREAAAALLTLALWHTDDDPQLLLGPALRAHAEEARLHHDGDGASSDGICLLVPEAVRRLEAEGWSVEIAEDGLKLANGKLNHHIPYRDSLDSLVARDDTDSALHRLRKAKAARKRLPS
ncbi:hypothetical protein OG728_39395 (plasmid) [Streptomyces microflavus]|uniref:hypothetical protein n=1 Tax=Streptomyces microflavus TaxID=1919 RepID=UPI002E115C13|nr:hypothetical protein OG728_39395 [Streptomyces microflavus]